MCRFVAFKGRESVLLYDILGKHENSLIKQSRSAMEGKSGVNGDGFGIGWYDLAVQKNPAIFKSVQPAWNDLNLRGLTTLVKSSCLLGHVRASTIGDVGLQNCHPFSLDNLLFVHNGTIDGFEKIKKEWIHQISDATYAAVKGQTDSEHFFALIADKLSRFGSDYTVDNMAEAVTEALDTVKSLQKKNVGMVSYRINIALTDGQHMLVLKTCTPNVEKSLSLYLHQQLHAPEAFFVCSERLWSEEEGSDKGGWQEVPFDHFILVDKAFNIRYRALEDVL